MYLWKSKYIRPIFYKRYFDKKYGGNSWLRFDPGTLWKDLEDEEGVTPTQEVKNKVNGIKVLLTTTGFVKDPVLFEKIILAFNDVYVDVDSVQVANPEELAYGIICAEELIKSQEYGPKIKAYVQAACEEYGLIYYPYPFAWAQKTLKKDSFEDKLYEDIASGKHQYKETQGQLDKLDAIKSYYKERISEGEETK